MSKLYCLKLDIKILELTVKMLHKDGAPKNKTVNLTSNEISQYSCVMLEWPDDLKSFCKISELKENGFVFPDDSLRFRFGIKK